MNERIDEIAKEARDYAGGYWDEYSSAWFQFYNEKFAELIIRECAGILVKEVEVALDASGNPVSPEDFIKEHFGVK